jgi:ferric-dicitrate binding protein FerR (iron transport regulator)
MTAARATAWYAGARNVMTRPAEREALIAWFDKLPLHDPARQNPELRWFIYKIRRTHKRAGARAA